MKNSVRILGNIAAGDFKKDLDDVSKVQRRSENDIPVPAFIRAMEAINALVGDSKMLSAAAVEGNLATRADATRHAGDFQRIVEDMNRMLAAVADPIAVSASYVERISKGDIPEKITTEYKGDFNTIKQSLNRCIDTLDSLLKQMAHMSHEHELGDIDVVIDSSKFDGAFRSVAQGVDGWSVRTSRSRRRRWPALLNSAKATSKPQWRSSPVKKPSSTTPSKPCADTRTTDR